MANCPECNAKISDDAESCEYCGKKIYTGKELGSAPHKITTWQIVVIVISIFILIAIGLTFQEAEKRENRAAQATFSSPVEAIIDTAAQRSGLSSAYGKPEITLSAQTKRAIVYIDFPRGPMTPAQASQFALDICGAMARTYVQKGYMPRALAVSISSAGKDGVQVHYGAAVYNGDVDILGWEPASGK